MVTLNADTGRTLWNYTLGSWATKGRFLNLGYRLGEPVVVNGVAYLSVGYQIYAIGLPPVSTSTIESFPVMPIAATVIAVIIVGIGLFFFLMRKNVFVKKLKSD